MDYKSLSDTLYAYGERVTDALRKNAQPHDAGGALAASVSFTVNKFGNDYGFALSIADYYKWVDGGRTPGKRPPVQSIMQWIDIRGLTPVTKTHIGVRGKSLKLNRKGLSLKTLKNKDVKHADASLSVAFAIATTIGKNGIQPTHFYTDVFKSGGAGDLQQLNKELSSALKQDVITQIQLKQ